MFQATNPVEILAEIKQLYPKQLERGWNLDTLQKDQKKDWSEEHESIEPHFDGEMSKAVNDAFPNESARILAYRKNIYRSETQPRLNQAIADVKAVVMGDQMYFDASENLKEYAKTVKTGAADLLQYLFNIVYPRRVVDPNALLCIVPHATSDPAQKPQLEAIIYESEDIAYYLPNELAIIWGEKKGIERTFLVFAPNVYFEVQYDTAQDTTTIYNVYAHRNGRIGVEPLGGMPVAETDYLYYKSDFAKAVPVMDSLDIVANQCIALMVNTAYPVRVELGIECGTCEGKRTVAKRNADGSLCLAADEFGIEQPIKQVCPDCNGSGVMSSSALEKIVIPPHKNVFGETGATASNIAERYIGFVSPDTSNLQLLISEKESARKQVDEALNLTRTSDAAQSGEAKRRDREGKYTQLKSIADGLAHLLRETLVTIACYFTYEVPTIRENEIAAIRVYSPQDFDVLSSADLEAEYYANQDLKPLVLRYKQAIAVLSAKYPDDPHVAQAAKLAFELSNGMNLLTTAEVESYLVNGLATTEEIIRAKRAESVFYMLLNDLRDNMPSKDRLFQLANEKLSQMLPAPRIALQFDPNTAA